MELKGKIKLINPTKEYGAKGFKKRELVIETGDDYPQFITVEFIQDKCEVLNSYNVGDIVTIGINIQGRNGKTLRVKLNILTQYKVGKLVKRVVQHQHQ
jgi:hypothetical protein